MQSFSQTIRYKAGKGTLNNSQPVLPFYAIPAEASLTARALFCKERAEEVDAETLLRLSDSSASLPPDEAAEYNRRHRLGCRQTVVSQMWNDETDTVRAEYEAKALAQNVIDPTDINHIFE